MNFRRFALVLPLSLIMTGAHAEVLRFRGTVGQRNVTLMLDVQNELVSEAKYKYDDETSELPVSESRLFGATVVLADDDGNNFHLHLQDAGGASVTTFARTRKLTGTMQRGEMDLPVKLDLLADPKQ